MIEIKSSFKPEVFSNSDLPPIGSVLSSRVLYLMMIGFFGSLVEIFLTPPSAWQSVLRLESLISAIVVIVVEYVLAASILGLLWGVIVFLLQRASRSEQPFDAFFGRVLAGDGGGDAQVFRPAFLTALFAFLAFLMGLLFFLNMLFLKEDFHNMPLAAAALLCAGVAAVAVAFVASLPVFIFARAVFSHPIGRAFFGHKPWNPRRVNMVVTWVILALAALVIYVKWGTVQRIRFYDAYLLVGALTAVAIVLVPLRKILLDQRDVLLKVVSYSWPPFFIVGFVALLFLTEDSNCRYVTFEKTTLAGHILKNMRSVLDFDMDGYPAFMGGGDCAPLDPDVYPDNIEIPGNGKDDNCVGGDRPRGDYRNPDKAFDVPKDFLEGNYRLLLISIDAARPRNMSLYGYERETTKNISDWVQKKDAFVFTRAYCHIPATRWALPLIFSSLYPSDIQWEQGSFPQNVGKSTLMLAESLKKNNFYTSAYWTAHKQRWGLDQGFDKFNVKDPREDSLSGKLVTEYAVNFLNHNKDVRFFLWLHYYEPHDPYVSHDEINFGKKDEDNYDEEIWFVDRELGKVFAEMDSLGTWENTVVLLISDHGEGFMEHGQRHHSYQTYDEMTNIPMVWWIPGRKGSWIDKPVGQLDIVPTVLNLFGLSDGWNKYRGRTMAALFFGEEDSYQARPQFISTSWTYRYPKGSIKAVSDGAWKLIYNVPSQVYELYDLKADPMEQKNIFDWDLEPVQRLLPTLYHEIDEIKPNRTFIRDKGK